MRPGEYRKHCTRAREQLSGRGLSSKPSVICKLILFCIYVSLQCMLTIAVEPSRSLSDPVPSEFTANPLRSFGNESFSLEANSVAVTSSGFVIAGSITSSTGATIPFVEDEPDIVSVNTTAKTGLVMMLDNDGKPMWARRTCYLEARVSLVTAVSPSGVILVAGSSSSGVGRTTISNSFLVLMGYTRDGKRKFFVTHSGPGAFYSNIVLGSALSGRQSGASAFLACQLWRTSEIGESSPGRDRAMRESTCVTEASTEDGRLLQHTVITKDQSGTVESEKPRDMALSTDGKTVYVICRRVTVRDFKYNITEHLYAIDSKSVNNTMHTLSIRTRLGSHPKLSVPNALQIGGNDGTTGVYVAQLASDDNMERIIVQRLDKQLRTISWPKSEETMFEYIIEPDAELIRYTKTALKGMSFQGAGVLQILVVASAAVNSEDVANVRERLSNGRPAIINILPNAKVGSIVQALTRHTWIPNSLAVNNDRTLIVGKDLGAWKPGTASNESILVTALAPLPYTPDMTANGTPSASPDIPSPRGCIGESSVFYGRSLISMIRSHGALRLQYHPIQRLWLLFKGGTKAHVRMLCYRTTYSKLCATSHHVLQYGDSLMYMHELCTQHNISCYTAMERPLNFKGDCKYKIRVHASLYVTMHATHTLDTRPAAHIASRECAWRRLARPLWLLQTL